MLYIVKSMFFVYSHTSSRPAKRVRTAALSVGIVPPGRGENEEKFCEIVTSQRNGNWGGGNADKIGKFLRR